MGKIFNRHPYLLLTLICLFSYSISLFYLPVTDRDEGRFVQATKQMVETGDYLTIKFQDDFRNKKPAGIYWLQAAAVKAMDQPLNTVWPYRLPSLISALIAVLLTYYFAQYLFDSSIARTASLFMASSTILIVEATTAKTDSALLVSTLLAMGLLAMGYKDTQKELPRSLLLGASLAVGTLIKGPLLLFFFGTTVIALLLLDKNRQWIKNFHWFLICLIPIAVVLPWFFMIQKATGGHFAQASLGDDFSKKILSVQEGHGAPPGFFTLSLFIGLWSAALWLFPAIKKTWEQRKTSQSLLFCLSATLPALVILECIPTKLIHYPLPLYPWFAMIAASGFHHQSLPQTKLEKASGYIFLLMSLILAAAFMGITSQMTVNIWTWSISGLLGTILFSAAYLSFKKRFPYTIGAAVIVFPLGLSLWLPQLSAIWVTEQIYETIGEDLFKNPPILLMGYGEPSAVFRLGTKIVMSRKPEALAAFLQNAHGHLFIDQKLITGDVEKLLTLSPHLRPAPEITGINYNKMKLVHLKHYTMTPKLD